MSNDEIHRIFSFTFHALSKSHCLPFQWDSAGQKLYFYTHQNSQVSEKRRKLKRRALLTQFFIRTSVFVMLPCQELFATHSKQSELLAIKILHWMTIACLFSMNTYFRMRLFHAPKIVQYVKGLFKFTLKLRLYWREQSRKFTETIILIFTLGYPFIIPILPTMFVIGLYLLDPYEKTSLAGYWLLRKHDTSGFASIGCYY